MRGLNVREMKVRPLAVGIFAIMVLGAAGCSTVMERKSTIATDSEKVALVNALARQRGIEVIWVNPPRKQVENKAKPENLARN